MIKTTKLRYLVIVFSLLVLGACASAERRPAPSVSPENRAGLVLVEISQHEIDVDKPNVGNGGGGLIGALIETAAESYMDKNRQAAIAPIRDALIDVDFAEQALSKLNGRIHAGLVREDAKFQLVRGEPEADRVLLDYNDQNIMLINLRYGFEQDFRALYVHAWVGFGDYGSALDKKGNPVTNADKNKSAARSWVQYESQFPLRDASGSYTPNIERWMNDGGAPIRDALERALTEVTDLITTEFSQHLPVDPGAEQRPYRFLGLATNFAGKGKVVLHRDERVLLSDSAWLIWTDDNESRR